MLEDLLSKLGASTKITVGVSVSPSVGLEMIVVDKATNTVEKYGHKPLEYNHSTREIADFGQFQTALQDLFDELRISPKSNVIISLPNVLFGMITLPLLLPDEAITNAIISEVEQSYIFKRQEPTVTWTEIISNVNTENRVIAYTALQKFSIEGITAACADVGCTVVGIENSYSSLLRALAYTNSTKEQMKEGITWNLMVIGQNSYSILSLTEKKVMEYYEEPLALKSFVGDEIYNAITTSAQLTLASLPANYLCIISETDLVSAEVLSMKMNSDSTVSFIECNKYTQDSLLPANLNILPNIALDMTPEAIGTAISPFYDYPLKLNLVETSDSSGPAGIDSAGIPKVRLGNLEIELTPAFIKRMALLIGAIVLIPLVIATVFIGNYYLPQQKQQQTELQTKIETTQAEIKKYSDTSDNTFDAKAETNKIITQNKTKITYYAAMGMSIPNKLWVTYYGTNEAGKVDIKGKASNVENVYAFYKSLKELVNNSDIRLYKLEIASESIDDVISGTSGGAKYYEFEITNMTEEELHPSAKPATGTPADQQQAQPAQPQQPASSGPQLGKPLFGGQSNSGTGGEQAPGATANPPAQTQGGEGLPPNLKSIEKF